MNTLLVVAISAVLGIFVLHMRKGAADRSAPPVAGLVPSPSAPLIKGRVDEPDKSMIWYEATTPAQIPHVRGEWDRRMEVMAQEGRMFLVDGNGGCTTWDDRDGLTPTLKGLETRSHYLRIEHSHWRHDMDNDAIVIEFMSAADLDLFRSRIPAGGPARFDFRAMLGAEGSAELGMLLAQNRARTVQEL